LEKLQSNQVPPCSESADACAVAGLMEWLQYRELMISSEKQHLLNAQQWMKQQAAKCILGFGETFDKV